MANGLSAHGDCAPYNAALGQRQGIGVVSNGAMMEKRHSTVEDGRGQ